MAGATAGDHGPAVGAAPSDRAHVAAVLLRQPFEIERDVGRLSLSLRIASDRSAIDGSKLDTVEAAVLLDSVASINIRYHAQLYALSFVPASVARERERFTAEHPRSRAAFQSASCRSGATKRKASLAPRVAHLK